MESLYKSSNKSSEECIPSQKDRECWNITNQQESDFFIWIILCNQFMKNFCLKNLSGNNFNNKNK